ncbi:hypothetical protein Q5P01_021808 [Channa striata]|uniref:EGF-like domain-containing protein n=1 Tax=Channa striata TaxID=64152 RepID=A0AA88S709_CHASR|nr:hypothetical protein Q5P01_021808 [Channa striata]
MKDTRMKEEGLDERINIWTFSFVSTANVIPDIQETAMWESPSSGKAAVQVSPRSGTRAGHSPSALRTGSPQSRDCTAPTASPTVPPLHSEHFKPCHEKDLAYCLNGGECFVIETLSGPHKHCKCREGYQGIRCDQFLPKTDSILSDPNHLGIEFMESKEVYKRQVLSIISIAMAISLLGTLCMALYCRNKRRREKLQAQLKESRSLKNYTANSSNALDSRMRAANTNLQMHEYCKRPSQPRQGNVCESRFTQCNLSTMPPSSSRGTAKHHRSGSLSHSPDQRPQVTHWSAPRRTPPIPRGRLNPIGVSKYSGPAYQHLQEVDSNEKEPEAQKGCHMQGDNQRDDPRRDAILHMQTPVSMETPSPWSGHVEVSSGLCAPSQHCNLNPATRSLRRPSRRRSHSRILRFAPAPSPSSPPSSVTMTTRCLVCKPV